MVSSAAHSAANAPAVYRSAPGRLSVRAARRLPLCQIGRVETPSCAGRKRERALSFSARRMISATSRSALFEKFVTRGSSSLSRSLVESGARAHSLTLAWRWK